MILSYYPFHLKFKHPFKIASGTRDSTPVVFVEIQHNGMTGYGEAALPPYLSETQESVTGFLKKVDLSSLSFPFQLPDVLDDINSIEAGHFSAKAALDMALHDLSGKLTGQPVYRIWLNDSPTLPLNTYTIGMDTPDVIIQKLEEAEAFSLLKIKLGGPFDNLIIKTIRENTNKPLCVDANQGWTDAYFALDMINWLAEQQVIFIEQPLPKTEIKKMAWLKNKSPIPVIGDESVQGFNDLDEAMDLFHGINIKLMKSGGIHQAHRMIEKAKQNNMKILIGCMSESSCGVSAAAQLAGFADWTDLDGPLLITNDPFTGITYEGGKIILPDGFGTGVEKRTT